MMTETEFTRRVAEALGCTKCNANPGRPCVSPSGNPAVLHAVRRDAYRAELDSDDEEGRRRGSQQVVVARSH